MNLTSVWDFLAYRYVPGPRTLFASIRKLPPATCATWEKGRLTERRYWSAPDRDPRGQTATQERAVDVVQVDPVTCGGVTSALKILRLADEAGLKTSSHCCDELSAHLLCASQHPIYLEKHAFALDPYLVEPQRVVNGHVRPAEVPGTGVRFDPSALAPHRG